MKTGTTQDGVHFIEAAEGKYIKRGNELPCTTYYLAAHEELNLDKWYEVNEIPEEPQDESSEEADEADYAEAGRILLGEKEV